jgi:glycosyltransferase involved in cell wall biosynthesis
VVLSYNSRKRIDAELQSLRAQDFQERFEVVVVDSGQDDCAAYVRATYPEVRVVHSEWRLYPGQARNVGVNAARGRYVAFLSDDCVAQSDWLRRRVAKHREGFVAVGGAITNGTPLHPVGSAGYYLDYASVIPSERILASQPIPHSLSFERVLFERLGPYPEDTLTGEDTLFNKRCLDARALIGFDAGVRIAHRNLTGIRPYLQHQYEHGRGLIQCVERHGLRSPTGPAEGSVAAAMYRLFIHYPACRWWNVLKCIARGQPRWLPGVLLLTPFIWAGLWATAAGAWVEWRSRRPAR